MNGNLESPEIKFVACNSEVFNDIGNNAAWNVAWMPGECNEAVGAEGIGVMPVTASVAQMNAADFSETPLQLAAIERRVFAHGSRGEHEFIAERGRNRAARFEQGFQMGFGRLLKTEDRLASVAPVRVATGKQVGFSNPHSVFVAPRLDFRFGHNHSVKTITFFTVAVNGCRSNCPARDFVNH
jgi:hypothetical protein